MNDTRPPAATAGPEVSLVVPVYGDGAALDALVGRVIAVFERLDRKWELILVNDGSPRETWTLIERLATKCAHVRGINLQRNFGQHNALLAGIHASAGDVIVTLDDDLQHPPEEVPRLLEALTDRLDVVYGIPLERSDSPWRGISSAVVRVALASVLGARTARYVTGFRAFRGPLRRAFAESRSPYVSIDVFLSWATARVGAVEVRHDPRAFGRSNYTVGRLLAHATNMVMGFSVWPLRLASLVGFALTCFGAGVLVYVVGRYLLFGTTVPGFPFLASVIGIFSGAQLFALGIIGEYLARMYYRTMDRPAYVVESTTGCERS
jgi:glycosyltransferase involved in cell wall biosynthesis